MESVQCRMQVAGCSKQTVEIPILKMMFCSWNKVFVVFLPASWILHFTHFVSMMVIKLADFHYLKEPEGQLCPKLAFKLIDFLRLPSGWLWSMFQTSIGQSNHKDLSILGKFCKRPYCEKLQDVWSFKSRLFKLKDEERHHFGDWHQIQM